MKLLIITQKVDRTDPILGFFHRWIEEFAKHCERVTVIGQSVGEHRLPANVAVHSLGKEHDHSRARQAIRFWSLQWKLRREYDTVLVHMTPIWVVLGAPLWFLLRKRLYLWYEVRRGGVVLRAATWCVHKVFSATPSGLPFVSAKNVVTGHGIDTELFRPGSDRDPHLLCSVGRVTGIKHFDLLVRTVATLSPEYRCVIAGGPLLPGDQEVLRDLEGLLAELGLSGRVTIRFHSQQDVAALLARSSVFLHAAGGGLDKVVLEAMACECLVLSAGEASVHVLPPPCFAERDAFASKLSALLALDQAAKQELGRSLRQTVIRDHNLPTLIARLVAEMK